MPQNTKQNSKTADSVDIPRVAISENGKIIYASPAFCDLSHISASGGEGLNADEIILFGNHVGSLAALESGVHDIKINGHQDFFSFQFDWITGPDQKRLLIASHHTNPKTKPAKKHLKEFEERVLKHVQARESSNSKTFTQEDYNIFHSVSDQIMLVMNRAGDVLRKNEPFEELSQKCGIKARAFFDLFEDAEQPHIKTMLQTLSLPGEGLSSLPVDFETRIRAEDNTIWIRWQCIGKDDHIYAVGTDISAIKFQQEALSKREKQLLEAESIGGIGHWHWTIGSEDIEWSEEIFRIFDVEKTAFVPSFENMNAMVHRQDLDRVNHVFQRALLGQNNYEIDFRIQRPSGEKRYIRCEGRCAFDEEGDVVALYGVMQDMTERILYEKELKDAKNEAERAYAAKSQFLANMSHELRTPLNAIIGFSEMMQRQLLGPIGNESYNEYINGIRESGEHLLDLISDILDMSKIEAGKYELDLERFDVTKTLSTALNMIEGRALESNIKLISKGMREAVSIVADRRAVMQIMLNILSNAVKFSRPNSEIRLECETRDDFIILRVSDNGIGIPANKLKQITRPFEQVSLSYARDHEGSGLGLAITKELVEMHGGGLFIDSVINEGTTVTVRLPFDAHKVRKIRQAKKNDSEKAA